MSNVVPEGWAEHTQGDIADFSNGKAYKLTEWEETGTPVIRLQNLTGSGKNYYYSNLQLPKRQYCEEGDLLYMWSATFGPHIWKGPKAIYHYHIWKVTCNETDITKPYLYQLLGFKTAEWLNKSNGMGILHITKGGMEELKLVLPPLPEQKKIAAILTSVDDVIEKTQAQIDKLKDLKTGMMQELLTRGVGVDGKPHTEFKDSPVGMIPKGWDVQPLEDLVKPEKKITYGIVQAGPHSEGGVPYIRVSDMNLRHLSRQGMLLTSPEIAKKFERSSVSKGDIVYALRGMIGHVHIVPVELEGANLTQGTARISPCENVDTNYLLWAMRSPYVALQNDLEAKGSTFKEVTLASLRKIQIATPPIEEQQYISSSLSSIEAKFYAVEDKLIQLKSLKKALMQDLLTGKVRVKVDS